MRLFEPEDYPVIQEWFALRNMPSPAYVYLPKTGFIVDYYAAGFLIATDTPIACIDFLISNPEGPLKKTTQSIRAVVQALIEEARRHGYKAIKSSSNIQSVGNLARSMEFHDLGMFNSFYREI